MSDRWHPETCRGCGHKARNRLDVSSRGLCRNCGAERLASNLRDLISRSGPGMEKWAQGMARAAARYTGTPLPR